MMKFFRKHMKKLLMVFMVALLIVWLGGTALNNMLRGAATQDDVVWGTIYGREVEQKQINNTNYHAETLNVIYPQWRETLSPNRDEQLDDFAFFMLVTEAVDNGIYISPARIDKIMEMIAPERLNFVRKGQYKRSLERIRQAIEMYLMVQKNMSQASTAVLPSEADIQHIIRQIAEKAEVSVLIVPAREFFNETYEPSDDDLSEHFEKYKNEPQNYSLLEFGYQMEEAAQVEYIQVNIEALTEQQTVTEQDAYDYWKGHQKEFLAPLTQTQPSTNPANRPKREPYETFTEAKADVLVKLRERKGKDAALSVARELISLLTIPWADAPTTQPEGYKKPPASEKADDVYQKLIDRLQGKYAGVLKYGRTELLGRKQAWRAEGIGATNAMMGTPMRSSFTQVAFMVPGMSTTREDDKQRARFFRNIWETCSEPLTDAAGYAYVFRTIAARPAQPPASFEDVREDLVTDLRRLRAYEKAERLVRDLVDNTGDKDLEAAFDGSPELISKFGRSALRKLPPFPRAELAPYSPDGLRPVMVPGLERDEEFIDLCFASPDEEHYVKIHERKQFGQWVVVQRHKIIPVNRAEFDEQREKAQGQFMRKAFTDFRQEWLAAENIRKRVAWVPTEKPQSTEKDAEQAEDAKAKTDSAESTS